MSLRVLVPVAVAEEQVETTGTARRAGSLDGATIGIMYNSKPKAPELLGAVADLLRDRATWCSRVSATAARAAR